MKNLHPYKSIAIPATIGTTLYTLDNILKNNDYEQ